MQRDGSYRGEQFTAIFLQRKKKPALKSECLFAAASWDSCSSSSCSVPQNSGSGGETWNNVSMKSTVFPDLHVAPQDCVSLALSQAGPLLLLVCQLYFHHV